MRMKKPEHKNYLINIQQSGMICKGKITYHVKNSKKIIA